MGKKARLKQQRRDGAPPEAQSPAQLVDRYLRAIRAPATIDDRGEFWDWLDARHDADSAYLSDVLDGVVDDSKWGARCATLRLSIDHQFGFSGRLYRPLLRALAQRLADEEFGSVLDVGCENALIGCFVAALRPEVVLAGFDIERRAVLAATQLAADLSLPADFSEGNVFDSQWPTAGPFDVVLTMRALAGNALGESPLVGDHAQLDEVLRRLRSSLPAGGIYIAFERLQDAHQSQVYVEAAARHGLALDTDRTTVLVTEEIPGKVERIPLLFFSAWADAQPPPPTVMRELHERATVRAESNSRHRCEDRTSGFCGVIRG